MKIRPGQSGSNKTVVMEGTNVASNARETMGGLFTANPYEMTHEDCVMIFKKSYH